MDFEDLIFKYLNGNLSRKERNSLKIWVKKDLKHLNVFKEHIRSHAYVIPLQFYSDKAFEKFYYEIQSKKQRRKRRVQFFSIAASLSALIALGLLFQNSEYALNTQQNISSNINQNKLKQIQILLPDGSRQIIDKKSTNNLKTKNGILVASTTDRVLDFSVGQNKNKDTSITQIDIPYGEKLKIKLSDGTLVWLNSGTNFRFPQNFSSSSKSRKVKVLGEAYFEVAKNSKNPFIVSTPSVDVKVLGTHFNVSSYAEDPKTKTTLMEGKVQVYTSSNQKKPMDLKPNQQAIFQKTNRKIMINEVNAKDFNSWIDNTLVVDKLSFLELKKKLERKYNITITCEIEDLWNIVYKGEFQDESLTQTLETIALSSHFSFKIDGKHVTIFKENDNQKSPTNN